MTREDFRIVQKYYATSSLVMVFYKNVIIESVEIFKNYSSFEDEADKAKRKAEYDKQIAAGKKPKAIKLKPVEMKTQKDNRTKEEISAECEKKIRNYIANNE